MNLWSEHPAGRARCGCAMTSRRTTTRKAAASPSDTGWRGGRYGFCLIMRALAFVVALAACAVLAGAKLLTAIAECSYRLRSERGNPNQGSTLLSNRVMALMRSPASVRT